MDIIVLIRVVILITFLLLLVEGIAAIILARRAVRIYVRKHRDLETRVEIIERRLPILEK